MKCVCIGGPRDGHEYDITTQRLEVQVMAGKWGTDSRGIPAPLFERVVYERCGDVLLVFQPK